MMGLVLGIVPGIGGLTGTAMLLPFTFAMDPYSAFALLLGLGSTTSTGDPIPAILFGVPGGAASAATVLDGFPMAKRGEAGRALSAAYMSSLMGGIFGAALLAVSIPILRPVMLYLGSPELLAFSILGISMVAVLSGSAPLRGVAAACLGVMIAMIGSDPQTGTLRWTMDSLYLWDGLRLTPLLLGIFALPELCDLLIGRTTISKSIDKASIYKGQWQGVKDCMQNWWLIVRCSWIGGGIGSIPGISASVIDWLAYGHALKTEKGARETFGKGDVRGVIASESSNNAKEGGALVPTIAFGVPGSATMAILLGAFLIHGLVPGPDMLHKNLDITYTMVWSVALANILGAGLCYAFSPQFARLATLRYTLILPAVMGVVYIGAFEANRSWGDLIALLAFGVVGWLMKQNKWPRPPLVLGLVLGDSIERYMFISVERYGFSWLWRPVVAALLILALIGLLRPLLQDIRRQGGVAKMAASFQAPTFKLSQLFTLFFISVIGTMVIAALPWHFCAKLVPSGGRHRGAHRRGLEPVQRGVPQAGNVRRSGLSEHGAAGDWAGDPHGSHLRHRPPADARGGDARRALLRLPDCVHGLDGRDRPDSNGRIVRRHIHAPRGPGALDADADLCRGAGYLDLPGVRPVHVHPLAADAARPTDPRAEVHPLGLSNR